MPIAYLLSPHESVNVESNCQSPNSMYSIVTVKCNFLFLMHHASLVILFEASTITPRAELDSMW